MMPFYVYYSMFGFQRVGDLAWAAGDSRARGFLIGGTAGRTTLNGEGLQHEDGHSHIQASLIPNCVAYDPAYAYELAVVVQDGLRRMLTEHEDVFFYLTVMNENYVQPAMPEGAEEGILRGMHLVASPDGGEAQIQLLGSGTILREVLAAAELLRDEFEVGADVFSVTSFSELRRDGMEVERHNRLRAGRDGFQARTSFVQDTLDGGTPVVAATDYIRQLPDMIRPWVQAPYTTLGTDGFGRSDYRKALRRFFEVDRHHVVVAALRTLDRHDDAAAAVERYGIDPDAEAPWRT
jgi:pyruvate dehydrogenase E1 component